MPRASASAAAIMLALALVATGRSAQAGGQAPCDDPLIFSDAWVNIIFNLRGVGHRHAEIRTRNAPTFHG